MGKMLDGPARVRNKAHFHVAEDALALRNECGSDQPNHVLCGDALMKRDNWIYARGKQNFSMMRQVQNKQANSGWNGHQTKQ